MGKKTIILLFLILSVAAFFRLWNLKSAPPGLYPDEAMNGNNAREALDTGEWRVFYPENNGREGLFINIQALSIKIFGNEPWALRLVSAIFGILTVLGVYFLTKELFKNYDSEKVALLATFLIATSFWHVNFSRVGFRAIMAPFFLVWSFFLLFKSLNQAKKKFQTISNDQNSNNQNRFRILNFKNWNLFGIWNLGFGIWAIFAGLFYGLGFHSYIAYRVTPLLLIIPFFPPLAEKNKKTALLLFLFFAFLAVLPLGIYFLKNPQDFFGRTSQISILSAENPLKELGLNIAKTVGMFFWAGDYNWRHNLSGEPMLWWPIGALFLIGIITNVKRITDKKEMFLFSWVILGLLPVVFSGEGLPHALRAIIVIPPVMILTALGANWLFENLIFKWNKKLAIGLIFIFLTIVAIREYWQYFYRWAPDINVYRAFSGNYKALGEWLNAQPRDLPKYVIINAEGVKARGLPMPIQTVMFITDTFSSEKQKAKNIIYLLPEEKDKILCQKEKECIITALEND